MYGHNSVVLVRAGDKVKRGDRIAFSGNTGVSSAPHLHYEIAQNGRLVDPTGFLGRLSQGWGRVGQPEHV